MALCASAPAAAAVIGRPSAFFYSNNGEDHCSGVGPAAWPSDAFSRWLFQRQQVRSVRLLRVRKKECDGGGKKIHPRFWRPRCFDLLFLFFSRVFSSSSQRILVQRSATLRRDRFDFAPMLDAVGAALSFVVFLCFKGSSRGRALFCHPLRFLQLCLSLRQYTSDLR